METSQNKSRNVTLPKDRKKKKPLWKMIDTGGTRKSKFGYNSSAEEVLRIIYK